MSSILTNTGSMVALQTLKSVNKDLGMVQEQISTGKKVGNARDNAAIWAISTVMSSDVSGFKAISESLSLGSSSVALARSASEQVTNLLQEMKAHIVAAQEDNVDRSKIQNDVSALRDQITSIVDSAQFNGLNFLKGGGSVDILSSLNRASDGTVTTSNISIAKSDLQVVEQVYGAGGALGVTTASAASIAAAATENVTFTAGALTEGDSFQVTLAGTAYEYVARDGDTLNDVATNLKSTIDAAGVTGVTITANTVTDPTASNVSLDITNGTAGALTLAAADNTAGTAGGGLSSLVSFDVSTAVGAESALAEIETLVQVGITSSAAFGSGQKRVEIQNDFVSKLMDSLTTGIGALVDADMEEASARLQALQVQQQLGVQALSIANQSPQNILSLFR